jgi:hypothetical protein
VEVRVFSGEEVGLARRSEVETEYGQAEEAEEDEAEGESEAGACELDGQLDKVESPFPKTGSKDQQGCSPAHSISNRYNRETE